MNINQLINWDNAWKEAFQEFLVYKSSTEYDDNVVNKKLSSFIRSYLNGEDWELNENECCVTYEDQVKSIVLIFEFYSTAESSNESNPEGGGHTISIGYRVEEEKFDYLIESEW